MIDIILNRDQYFEFEKVAIGAFDPLNGFMTEKECNSVVETMRLPGGKIFPIPVLLDINITYKDKIKVGSTLKLNYQDTEVGYMEVESIFSPDKDKIAFNVFGTNDRKHPGVMLLYKANDLCVGGKVEIKRRALGTEVGEFDLTPTDTKAIFKKMGWKTIAGFQTRNVPHRAHEYLQRTALEFVDALFIHPLIGRKKTGDYTPEAIRKGYEALISKFYPKDRVLLSFLTTQMRYAGPREAIFHALIRKNYGCTHFIVGRDHAGVGSYYKKYEAQELARSVEAELGITILPFFGPYHCKYCEGIVTEKTCAHFPILSEDEKDISGTEIRKILLSNTKPDSRFLRQEVYNSLENIPLFIEE